MPQQNNYIYAQDRIAELERHEVERHFRRLVSFPVLEARNRDIRLRQVTAVVHIHQFRWRYKICNRDYTIGDAAGTYPQASAGYESDDDLEPSQVTFIEDDAAYQEFLTKRRRQFMDGLLEDGRLIYFDMVLELVSEFWDCRVDLSLQRHNLSSGIELIKDRYLALLPRKEREKEGLWAKIWWFRHLQEILQDESLSLSSALKEGWKWFVDPDQWPTKSSGRSEFAEMWTRLNDSRKEEFFNSFDLNEDMLKDWFASLSTAEFCCDNAVYEEGEELQRECQAIKVDLLGALDSPKLAEEAFDDGSICILCDKDYRRQDGHTNRPHIPTRVVPCGHVFGSSCLLAPLYDGPVNGKCAICKVRLGVGTSPQELIEGCDRILRWTQPPAEFQTATGPDSFLSKLMLIFEPTDEIRRHEKYWLPYTRLPNRRENASTLTKLRDLGLFQARERLAAVVNNDVARYREVLVKQAQTTAQRIWLEFLASVTS